MPKGWLSAAKNVFFPLLCLSCSRKIKEGYLCPECQSQIEILKIPACYSKIPGIKMKTISSASYKGPLKDLIYHFKYRGCSYLDSLLSQLMIRHLESTCFWLDDSDFIVPVPLSPHKAKMRGYNQAELLARHLANYFKLNLKSDIISSKYVKNSQAKLTPEKRRANVVGKFQAKRSAKNKNIILIDDVLTTGATLSACWQTLKEKGAKNIWAITLAK